MDKRPTEREIMEQIGLDTLDFPTLCYAAAWLMFIGLIVYACYRVTWG